MSNPESKKSNRTLLLVGGGCILIACLCMLCLGGFYFFGQSQLSQISSQLGLPSNSASAEPTAAPFPTNSGAPTAPRPAATQPPSGGNPADALLKSVTSWGSVKTFRVRMALSGGVPAAAQNMTMEMVMPDRIHMTSAQFEMILIGNTSYVKIGPTWQKMSLPQSVDVNQFNPKTWQTTFQGLTAADIKLLGPDTVEGVPTIVYQFGSTGQGTAGAATKVWVGVADGFPHKIESGGATMTFYDFNANITINPPIP